MASNKPFIYTLHIVTSTLKNVISKQVHSDQSGYIKGRNISFNIRLIPDIIVYFEENELKDVIILLDFQKVFDRVSHLFLQDVLINLNFVEIHLLNGLK